MPVRLKLSLSLTPCHILNVCLYFYKKKKNETIFVSINTHSQNVLKLNLFFLFSFHDKCAGEFNPYVNYWYYWYLLQYYAFIFPSSGFEFFIAPPIPHPIQVLINLVVPSNHICWPLLLYMRSLLHFFNNEEQLTISQLK